MAGRNKQISFEERFAALEALISKMETEMPLEESMAAYEEGVRLYQALLAQLDASEKRMKILSAPEDEEKRADARQTHLPLLENEE